MTPPLTPLPNELAAHLARPVGQRAAILATVLFLAPLVAWLIGPALGITAGIRGLVALSFAVVVVVGYQLWWLRILVAGSGAFAGRLTRGVWPLISRREERTLRPTPDEVHELASRTLATSSGTFRTVARAAGVILAIVVGFNAGLAAALGVLMLHVFWGESLAWLGREGWLPIPEPE